MKKGKIKNLPFSGLCGSRNREMWKTTFNAMRDSVGIIDLESRFILYNEKTPNLLRTTDKTIASSRCHELVHHADTPPDNCPYERMKKSKQHETEVFHEDGRWLEVSVDPLFDRNGEVSGAVHVLRDITERVQHESAEKEAAAHIQSLVDNAADSIWAVDTNFNYIFCNNFFKQAYYAAYHRNLIEGMNALEDLDSELREFWKEKYETALAGEKIVFEFSEELRGARHFFRVSMNPVFVDSKVVSASVVSVDITENIQTEKELSGYRDHLEEKVKERTRELEEKNRELEQLNKLFVDREFRIKELREQVKKLEDRN